MTTAKRSGGLGRGLGALIPTAGREDNNRPDPAADQTTSAGSVESSVEMPSPSGGAGTDAGVSTVDRVGASVDADLAQVPGVHFAELPVDQIGANTKQPRQVFDEDALHELMHSIREFGVLQPVVVRRIDPATVDKPNGDAPDAPPAAYELVMGERRLRAARLAGLSAIPAIVRDTADADMLRDALLENIHRAALNPLEEAAAYQQLLDEFDVTHEQLAQRLGRSRSQVSNTIRLMNLPVPVQRRVAAGVLSAGHARALLALPESADAEDLAARIVAEGMSVRATEEAVTLAQRGEAPRAKRSAARQISAPAVTGLADRLSDAFDTHVKVELGRRKGRITVEFATIDDLERIVALMAPEVARQAHGQTSGELTTPEGVTGP